LRITDGIMTPDEHTQRETLSVQDFCENTTRFILANFFARRRLQPIRKLSTTNKRRIVDR
jgi:hypothetical protein